MVTTSRFWIFGLVFAFVIPAANASLVASWGFQGNLNSDIGGAALTAFNPLGQNSFTTTTLYGQSRQIYNMFGSQGANNNAGLQVTPSFLSNGTSYSLEVMFSQTNSPNTNGYRKIYDNSGLAADQGLYVTPASQMYYFSDGGSPTGTIATNTFYNVILTYNGTSNAGNVYVNGALNYSFTGLDPAITNNALALSFFMDDAATGHNEFSDASVGLIKMWNTELTAGDVANIENNPFAPSTPEPATMAAIGIGLAGLVARRRRSA